MGRIREILSQRLGRFNLALAVLLLTVAVVIVVYVAAGGEMFSPGELNAEPRRHVARGGVKAHADLAGKCSACHAPAWSGQTMADRCLACHTNVRDQIVTRGPMHGRLAGGMRCSRCHTEHEGSRGALTTQHAIASFDHDCAAFRLTGAHRAATCQACHVTGVYQGTPQTCAACHADPPVHKGRFGANCTQCHSTNTWVSNPANLANLTHFDHDLAAFKLTGKHRAVDCRACHKNDNAFLGTPRSCVSCHVEPKVHAGRFGVSCGQCHSTETWLFTASTRSSFNHDLAAFKLTGKHQTIDCQACHVNDGFRGTTRSCVGCHSEPKMHKGRFGTNCADCHSTHTWDGAEFKHTIFSMTHRGSNNQCASCHNEPDNLKSYTCYNCHHHTPAREAQRHARRNIAGAKLDDCIACHAAGKRGKRTAEESVDSPLKRSQSLVSVAFDCPSMPSPGLTSRHQVSCPGGHRSLHGGIGLLDLLGGRKKEPMRLVDQQPGFARDAGRISVLAPALSPSEETGWPDRSRARLDRALPTDLLFAKGLRLQPTLRLTR